MSNKVLKIQESQHISKVCVCLAFYFLIALEAMKITLGRKEKPFKVKILYLFN